MISSRFRFSVLLCCLVLASVTAPLGAQQQSDAVTVRLSSRETYVGEPIQLQIEVVNGSTNSAPTPPDVDGLRFSRPLPTSNNRFLIDSQGRRSSTRSVTWLFQVTPNRAGEFTIPAFEIAANNQTYQTEPLKIVASKSETGDLLFVEIDDGSDGQQSPKGYVGQAIKLTLKIWLRPFTDRRRNYKLNARSMWQQFSTEETSWGAFQQALDDGVKASEVLRRDREGVTRSYYLYEIEATVYPKRPGKIDVDDVNIVVNYPTALDAVNRSRFGFGGIVDQMMDEMRGRPSRPSRRISATASSPSIRILEVPQEGRPEFYQGAVGKYLIVAEATPTEVNAGDSITLQLGLQGDGPMELVQAPPLSRMETLTRDFRVADDALAGFVQGNGKLFSTTLRPLREDIDSIPPIPFSYFDPKTEKFETTYTSAIPLKVAAANQLSLDEIVGGNATQSPDREPEKGQATEGDEPQFVARNFTANRLTNSSGSANWLTWLLLGFPPSIIGFLWLYREGPTALRRLRGTPRPMQATISAVRSAKTHSELSEALRRCESLSLSENKALRPGHGEFATSEMQDTVLADLLHRCERAAFSPASESLDSLRMAIVRELRKYE